MKYPIILKLFKKAIAYRKNKKFESIKENIVKLIEADLPAKRETRELSSIDAKRTELKRRYKKALKNSPFSPDYDVFAELIDQSPEEYLDYELGIDMNKAAEVMKELTTGSGDITGNEIANLRNVVSGVGIPAVEKYATGKHKMSKETGKFGSGAINKNIDDFLKSMKERKDPRGKLPAPKKEGLVKVTKDVVRPDKLSTIRSNLEGVFGKINIPQGSAFQRAASRLRSKGINIDRLARSIASAASYKEAKKKASVEMKKQGRSIEDLTNTDVLYNMWKENMKNKKGAEVRK